MKLLTAQQFLAEVCKLQDEKHIGFAQAVRQVLNCNKALVRRRGSCQLSRTCYGRLSCDLIRLVEWMSNHCLDDLKVACFASQVASLKCTR